MKPRSSSKNSKGKLFVDCAECKRGGNGEKNCASGISITNIKKGGCFSGQLLDKYQI